MQPQFLKDLFPDMEKPDFGDMGKKMSEMFSGLMPKEEEPAAEPAPVAEAPAEEAPAEEAPPA